MPGTVTIKKKDGTTFEMPWDKPGDPTPADIKAFLSTQPDDTYLGGVKEGLQGLIGFGADILRSVDPRPTAEAQAARANVGRGLIQPFISMRDLYRDASELERRYASGEAGLIESALGGYNPAAGRTLEAVGFPVEDIEKAIGEGKYGRAAGLATIPGILTGAVGVKARPKAVKKPPPVPYTFPPTAAVETRPSRLLPSVAESRLPTETPLIDLEPVVNPAARPRFIAGEQVGLDIPSNQLAIRYGAGSFRETGIPTTTLGDVTPVDTVLAPKEPPIPVHDTSPPPTAADMILQPKPAWPTREGGQFGLRDVREPWIEPEATRAVRSAPDEALNAQLDRHNRVMDNNEPLSPTSAEAGTRELYPNRLSAPGANQVVWNAIIPENLAGRTPYRPEGGRRLVSESTPSYAPVEPLPPKPNYAATDLVENRGKRLTDAELAEAAETKAAIRNRLKKSTPIYNRPILRTVPFNEVGAITPSTPGNLKQAFRDWANELRGAAFRSGLIREEFVDLPEGPEAIRSYQAGDRTGPLARLSKYYDAAHETAVRLGILKEDQFKQNYLRQVWDNTPEEISRAFKPGVQRVPGFAKESIFDTYEQGIAAGLKPKYTNLRDIVTLYEEELNRAIANRRLYNFLEKEGLVEPNKSINPSDWNFKGEKGKEARKYIDRHFKTSSLKNAADAVAYTKNIYLGAGIPFTPLNIHGYNIARSDIRARGAIKGIGTFFRGLFNPKSEVQFLKENRKRVAELIDKGYEYGVEDRGILAERLVPFDEFLRQHKAGRGVEKVVTFHQKLFEDPLFQVHLPYTKLKFTLGRIEDLTPKVGREQAIRIAVDDANAFYGGINKVLRDRTWQDLLRMGILAPDWFESRMRLAGKGFGGTARLIAGKGRPQDKLYAQSLGRGVAMDVAGKGAAALAGKSIYDAYTEDRPTDVTDIPLGELDGREVKFPTHGTASEDLRLPQQIVASAIQGDPTAALDIVKGRVSTPARSAWNLVTGRDVFGRPIRGRNVEPGENLLRTGKEALAPITYPWMQAFISLLNGDLDWSEAVASGLELPVEFSSPPRVSQKERRVR